MNSLFLTNKLGLFWQYPAITEKTFYNQEKNNSNYFALPWATIIDKKINLITLLIYIKKLVKLNNKEYYTCCQNIHFRRLIPLWKILKITTVYSPHKIKGQDIINGIKIKPCPLYAVSIEDKRRNKDIHKNFNKSLLYSFVGSYQKSYLTNIREKIFKLPKKTDTHIINRGTEWHLTPLVYSAKQNKYGMMNITPNHMKKTFEYNELLLKSKFTLAPSGSGPNSIRFWEALAVGSIPVLLADTLELPENKLWDETIIIIKESNIENLDNILRKIPEDEIKERSKKCIELYNFYKNNYCNRKEIQSKEIQKEIQSKVIQKEIQPKVIKKEIQPKVVQQEIIHYCCGCYERGSIGGVARYDYHIRLAFPNRIFFQGPNEKIKMLNYLKKCKNPIVITDNHLACDIPNNYKCFLVHHGVAQTHAEREPTWSSGLRALCCNGQKKMLAYRKPETTTIVSISQFCSDEFLRIYPSLYPKFKRIDVLHTSELDENRYLIKFNNIPRVLGNWNCINKGSRVIPRLRLYKNYIFNKLNVQMKNKNIKDFNKRKQDIYLQNDMFLNLSLCEGFSYSALDALICGLVVVSSDVGVFYKDVPDDCFVKLDWRRNNDVNYVRSKLEYAWKNREIIGKKGREWYLKNCSIINWKKNMLINIC
jgi:glycosyltransferase involved in cell wall biosynthesis